MITTNSGQNTAWIFHDAIPCDTLFIRALSVSKIYPYLPKSTKIYDQEIHGRIIAILAIAHETRTLSKLGSAVAITVVSHVAP